MTSPLPTVSVVMPDLTTGELGRSMEQLRQSIDKLREDLGDNYVRKDVYDVIQKAVRDELNRLSREGERAVSVRRWWVSTAVTAAAALAAWTPYLIQH